MQPGIDSDADLQNDAGACLDKIRSFIRNKYDSSKLCYLQKLPEHLDDHLQTTSPEGSGLSESHPRDMTDMKKVWWQGITRSLKRNQIVKQMWRGQLQVLVAVFIPITKLCISMLFCRPVPDGADIIWLSTYDTDVGCSDSTHVVAASIALLVLCIFTLGFPRFIYIKSLNRNRKPGRFSAMVRLMYIFKEDHCSWQAVMMLLQVWLVAAKVVAEIYASAEHQTLPIAAFNGVSWPLHLEVTLMACASNSHVSDDCRRVGLALDRVCADIASCAFAGTVFSLRTCARQQPGAVGFARLAVCNLCVLPHMSASTTHFVENASLNVSADMITRMIVRMWSGQGLTSRSPQTDSYICLCLR